MNAMARALAGAKARFGPELPLGRYIGSCRAGMCSVNSYDQPGYDIYVGYLIFPFRGHVNLVQHVFNVKGGRVHEFTDLKPVPLKKAHYFGRKFAGDIADVWGALPPPRSVWPDAAFKAGVGNWILENEMQESYHDKRGRFTSFNRANIVNKGGEKYKLVRTLEPVKAKDEAPPSADTAEAVKEVKAKVHDLADRIAPQWVALDEVVV